MPSRRLAKVRFAATKRKIAFDISLEDFLVLIKLPCFYCSGALPEAGGGLDRIDNEKGYMLGNVVPCCTRCNTMRNDKTTHVEMKAVIGLMILLKGLR